MNQSILKHIPAIICLIITLNSCNLFTDNQPTISIVVDENPGKPVIHGLSKLIYALEEKGISFSQVNDLKEAEGITLLVVGLSEGSGSAAMLARSSSQILPDKAESLSIWETETNGQKVWVVNGFDERGLMYALLEIADQIKRGSEDDVLSNLESIAESPDVRTRAISMYTMNRAYWETRFYDENYWASYMDMLARNRFNTVVVIFGYENAGFLAPCYPYFFDVEGYPDVKMGRITPAEQKKNLAALNRMIDMAHERGLDFKVGIWDHIYRGGVQAGGLSDEELANFDKGHLVEGLTAENLPDYTKAALTRFMQEVPDLDGIQFRMHNESGLKRGEEMAMFWNEVFTMIKSNSPEFKIDLRAKELPESIIQVAIDLNLNFTVATKYWMEQMGLPFHPTHINRENQFERRHGYADMLQYPKRYNIHWRMWTGGTHRLLLWGSPEYARRFVASTHLFNGDGYEVNEPLATKMEAQPHNKAPFDILNPEYVYYQYEFERYWHFYQVFGRLGYNPRTAADLWEDEFESRFGQETGKIIQNAMHKAAWVLPMIMAACAPYGKFPTTRGWAEKQRFGDLPEYAMAEGSDIQQFASFDTEAQLLVEGGETAKRLPSATSAWFFKTHEELNDLIKKLEDADSQNKELTSTLTDLKITSYLALFHSRRIPAAVSYRIYKQTGDPQSLESAIAFERQAIDAWKEIIESAGDVYAPDLMFGVRERGFGGILHHLSGHWKDELTYLEKGLDELFEERKDSAPYTGKDAPAYKPASSTPPSEHFEIQHVPLTTAPSDRPIKIKVTIEAKNGLKWAKVRYRSVNQHLDYKSLALKKEKESNVYVAEIPVEQIDPAFDFMYFIEAVDQEGKGIIWPDLIKETPYIIVELIR
ncbi:MAG: hypothetical protein RIA62_02420 [Cyclobacteriaceae bacterium]